MGIQRVVLVLAVCLGLVSGTASAQVAGAPQPGVVSHILVLSDKCEDVSSPEAWKETYIKEGMSDQEKAIAIWKTVVKYRHQDIPPHEGIDEGCVHDPLKTIHVYGYGMCCCASSNVEGLARYLGFQARGWAIRQHSVPEIWYDDAWHTIDCSLMNYFLKPDGKIAGVEEVHKAIKDWYAADPAHKAIAGNDSKLKAFSRNEGWKNGPPLLASCQFYDKDGINAAGWHGWWSNMQEYNYKEQSKQEGHLYDYGPSMGYELNVQLRAGEKITRNWFNKGLHIDMDSGRKGPVKLLKGKRDALGLQRELGDLAPGRIGNGTLEYDVPLADGSFRQGVLEADNLASTADDKAAPALHVKNAAQNGVLVVRMPCSYVYLGGRLTAKTVVSGGSVGIFFSDNHGLDWKEIARFESSGEQTVDLKQYVVNRYDYRLKFELKGAGTGLDALRIVNDFQHSQAPLPTLLEGENKITFSAGPPEGTITYEPAMHESKQRSDAIPVAAFHPDLKNLNETDFRVSDGSGGRGSATLKVATPGEMTRIRMNVHYRARDPKDGWDIEVSFDGGAAWRKVDHLGQGAPDSTRYLTIGDVPAGKKEALLRFNAAQRNTTTIMGLRIDADYREPVGGFRPVKITFVWDEGGEEKTDVHVAKSPRDIYAIKCGPQTTVKSFAVELAE